MADITDQELIAFSEQYVRPLAERLRNLFMGSEEAADQYVLSIVNHPAFIAASNDDVMMDSNGERDPYTKADLVAFIALSGQLLNGTAGFESAGGLRGDGMMDETLKMVVRSYSG